MMTAPKKILERRINALAETLNEDQLRLLVDLLTQVGEEIHAANEVASLAYLASAPAEGRA